MLHKSIVIIGGGPVGLTLALMLSKQGKKVTIVDQGYDKGQDGRILALSYASYQILNHINAWPDSLLTTNIDTVQISHSGLGISQITAESVHLGSLGFTVKYTDICNSLIKQVLDSSNISMIIGNVVTAYDSNGYAYLEYENNGLKHVLTCDLLIMAEGGKLLTSMDKKIYHDYHQQALIFHIKTKEKHNNIAHERFAGIGPLVLLPYDDHYVVVWSLDNDLAEKFKQDHHKMITQLDKEFTRRLGGANLLNSPVSFPLRLIQTKHRVHKRMILVGNSAQTVHPVSAQGLNLGLRDVSILNEILSSVDDVNSADIQIYDDIRNKDANAVIGFTHFLATKLEYRHKLIDHLRGAGIIGLSNIPALQNFVARSLIFGI